MLISTALDPKMPPNKAGRAPAPPLVLARGTPDQGPAHALKETDRATFDALMERITQATIEYLSAQIAAGAEVVKVFDSWAGSLKGADFERYAVAPARRIVSALSGGPHIFNLGHGITPDADPANVQAMIDAVRG